MRFLVRQLQGVCTFPSRSRAAAAALALALAAVAGGARAQQAALPAIDGIRCDQMEGSVFHIHQHLTLLDRGKPVAIPSDVGRPLLGACFYWLHTHTSDGIIHVEAPAFRTFTLGQFFDVWGQPLSATAAGPVRFKKGALHTFVDGSPYAGDPRKIELTQHADIVLEAGPPYVKPTPFTDWQGQ
jgi:hypothetical protein